MHSERSAQSLRSSLSSRSRQVGPLPVSARVSESPGLPWADGSCALFPQSQIYRNHGVTAASYEAPPPPDSLPGDYAYDNNFGSAQGFAEYGYAAEAGWAATEQGVCALGAPALPAEWGHPVTPLGGLSLGRKRE